MNANIAPLVRTLEHIKAHPAGWNQQHYRQQSTMCFAARTARLAGYKWKRTQEWTDPFMLDDNGREVHCREIAIRVLGFTHARQAVELFDALNTLEDLERIVQRYVNEAAEVLV